MNDMLVGNDGHNDESQKCDLVTYTVKLTVLWEEYRSHAVR
jgi:hypothetical protein